MDAYLVKIPSSSFINDKIIFWDIQGYRGHDKEFIIKEMAFISLDFQIKFQATYKPPFSKLYYPFEKEVEYTNTYIQNRLHNISWENGDYDYDDVLLHIKKILQYKPNKIYVKGGEKIKYLINLILENLNLEFPLTPKLKAKYYYISNIEDNFTIPNFKELRRIYETEFSCKYHDPNTYLCAKANVQLLRWFYLDNS